MSIEQLPDLGFDWDQAMDLVKTTGIDFLINLATAIVIFYVGKWVANLLTRTLRKVLQRQEIDVTLERFVCSLVRMVLLVFVVIAAISALGKIGGPDAMNVRQERYTEQRIDELLAGGELSAGQAVSRIVSDLRVFADPDNQFDDTTLLSAHRAAAHA